MTTLRIDIWSDIACPWCYIGKRHLEQALATFEHKDDVEIVWRAFELDPGAPKLREAVPNAERLAKKYRVSVEQAHAPSAPNQKTRNRVCVCIFASRSRQSRNTVAITRAVSGYAGV